MSWGARSGSSSGALSPGQDFKKKLVFNLSILSIPPVAFIIVYLVVLVRLPPDHLHIFLWVTCGAGVVLFPILAAVYDRMYTRIARVLDRMHEGTAEPAEIQDGYQRITRLPVMLFERGMVLWLVTASSCAGVTWLLADGMRPGVAFVLFSALISGGTVLEIFLSLAAKRIVESYRLEVANALDVDLREGVRVSISLDLKLRVAILCTTLVTVAFGILLANARSTVAVEEFVSRLQATLLTRAASRPEGLDIALLAREATELGAADEVALLSADGRLLAGTQEILRSVELTEVLSGPDSGDGTRFDSSNAFSWQRLPDGRVLVAAAPWSSLVADSAGTQMTFIGVLLASALLAWLAARVLSDDVTRAAAALVRQADGIADGDLRGVEIYDSEDELGTLGRTFDRMRGALREMVASVAETATRVEQVGGEIAGCADGVGQSSSLQTEALRDAGASVDRIHAGTRGIAESADSLARAVEESTSSAHELGAVGSELSDTAGSLSSKVDTVSSAVEEMAASIGEVARSADALAHATGETSGSIEQVASSVREVETHAGETARLSRAVVSAAERGRERVAQTTAGMQSIRRETETARAVIGSLGQRATEIGGILEVITDVADETNLLALNAAIISAQAGEHGRAFAVVADQIKALADRTLASTREIEERVRGVQEETHNAVAAIERGVESVAGGVSLASEAGESLEEITGAARQSGERIEGIVAAIREQSKAAAHVVELMEQLQAGVDRIRNASREQDRGNELILNEIVDMRHASDRVNGTAREQQAGATRIRDAFEEVGTAVERIRASLREQVEACAHSAELFEGMRGRTASTDDAVERMVGATRALTSDADDLRERVRRFRLQGEDA